MQRLLSLFSAFALILFLAACDTAEERAEAHYASALDLMAQGDADRAIVELRSVFQLVPNHLKARHEIARIFLEEKSNAQQAYTQYLRLVEQYPDDLKARVELSKLAFFSANWEELERHGERAQEISPDDVRVQAATNLMTTEAPKRLLNELVLDDHLRSQRLSEALVLLDALISENEGNQRYLRQRLQVLFTLGDQVAIEEQLVEMVAIFPDDPEHRQTLVRYFLSRGELDKTEAFLRDMAENAPEDEAGARIDLIRFLVELRGEDAARAEITSAISTAPNPIPYIMIGASLDFVNGNTQSAIASLEEAIADAPETSDEVNDMKATLARMLVATGNEVGARSLVETVLLEDPSHVASLKMNATWLIEADEADLAIGALRIALDVNPDDPEALTIMARAYTRSGSPDLARDFLSLAVEASGNAPEESIRYATLLISEERFRPAEDVLLPAIRISPTNVELLRTAAQLYIETKDTGRLRQVIDTLARIDTPQAKQLAVNLEAALINQTSSSDDVMAYLEEIAGQEGADPSSQVKLVLAKTHIAAGNLDEALAIYSALAQEFPNDASLIVDFAALQTRNGDPQTGRATIFTALEANPESPNLMWAAASYYEQEGDIDSAIDTYETLYQQDTSNLISANNLASLLATYRDDEASLDRAWTIARRFRDSDLAPIQDTYGWIAHRRGDSDEALPYLEDAAAGLPGDPIVQFHLAEVLFALNENERALAKFREVLDMAGIGDTRPQFQLAMERITEIEAAVEAATE